MSRGSRLQRLEEVVTADLDLDRLRLPCREGRSPGLSGASSLSRGARRESGEPLPSDGMSPGEFRKYLAELRARIPSRARCGP